MIPEFRFYPVGEDVIRQSLLETSDNTWLIYPTERSCKEALKQFQADWQPYHLRFLSIDDFKQNLIYSNNIRLQDEKRLVCLYQCLTPEDREVFHIEKYPDIIDWGQHFFKFFEELAEECINAQSLLTGMDNLDFDYQPWQYNNYRQMLSIRKQYLAFINHKGYTDKIADLDYQSIHLPEGISKFVFVNQMYYTALEKQIIAFICNEKLNVVICFQGQENWLDKDTLESGELKLKEAFPTRSLPFNLKVYQCNTHWQMALAFLHNYSQQQRTTDKQFIVDARFCEQPYQTVFDIDQFDITKPEPLHKTKLFDFFMIITQGLENLLSGNGQRLIKLDWLLQAVGIDGFIDYFRRDWTPDQKDEFIAFLCKLTENDILYLDTGLKLLSFDICRDIGIEIKALLKDIIDLLLKADGIDSVSGLTGFIDSENGICINRLITEQEKLYSSLPESFYKAIANFNSLDELALVDHWEAMYPGVNLAAGIFNLFLSFVKPKTYNYNRKQSSGAKPVITNLMDTRNLQAKRISFLNLTEGELPSGRESVWLFNERQRKVIGLKTWEAIRNWERYYFFRLIAGAQEVELYTVANQDENIEPSSFINELMLFAEQKDNPDVTNWINPVIPAETLFLNYTVTDLSNPLAKKVAVNASELDRYLILPFEKDKDLGQKDSFRLSWSACEHFLTSPFVYYLRDMMKLKERTVRIEETMNRKMFGNLMHSYLNTITRRLAEQHDGTLSMKWEWINHDFLMLNLKAALNDPLLTYQIPQNYNKDYLLKLMTPFLLDTASFFFQSGLAKRDGLKDTFIKIIPETSTMTYKEWDYKPLFMPSDSETGIGISIRGKADLRLETKDNRYIIDFKTGGYDNLQLVFYMFTYYLIDNPELEKEIIPAIYKLMDKQLEWLEGKTKYAPAYLIEVIKQALVEIVTIGYAAPSSSRVMKYYIDITRSDLMHKVITEEDESE